MNIIELYGGEDLLVKVRAVNPLNRKVLAAQTVTVACYNPSKDPVNNTGDRANPDYTFVLPYDRSQFAYYAPISTVGWVLGRWTLRVLTSGEVAGRTYSFVNLRDG